jgi:hypothetical protein
LNDPSLLASLDLEVAQFTAYQLRIKKVGLRLHGGNIKALSDEQDTTAIHKPGDQLTYLYKIKPDLTSDGTSALGNKGHYLTLNVEATVSIADDCQPDIAIEWKTPVDFASEQPASLKAAQRLSSATTHTTNTPDPDSLPAHDNQKQVEESASDKNNINITLTVSGPPNVRVGEIFTWDVFIVNRSEKTRKLAILVIAKRKRDFEKHHSHPSTSSSSGLRADKKELVATAVMDENIVYAKQKNARTETSELICLTTDIRLG